MFKYSVFLQLTLGNPFLQTQNKNMTVSTVQLSLIGSGSRRERNVF